MYSATPGSGLPVTGAVGGRTGAGLPVTGLPGGITGGSATGSTSSTSSSSGITGGSAAFAAPSSSLHLSPPFPRPNVSAANTSTAISITTGTGGGAASSSSVVEDQGGGTATVASGFSPHVFNIPSGGAAVAEGRPLFYWFPPDEEDYETPPGTTWVELVALSILLLGAAAALRSAFPRGGAAAAAAAAAGAGMGYASGPRPFRLRGTGGTGNYSALDKKFASSGGGSWEYLGTVVAAGAAGEGSATTAVVPVVMMVVVALVQPVRETETGRVVRIVEVGRGPPQLLPDLQVRQGLSSRSASRAASGWGYTCMPTGT
ncbi:unnamed protein product, partial [Closterium sp. NIES-65]